MVIFINAKSYYVMNEDVTEKIKEIRDEADRRRKPKYTGSLKKFVDIFLELVLRLAISKILMNNTTSKRFPFFLDDLYNYLFNVILEFKF